MRAVGALALCLAGCAVEDWRNADVQLDVRGAALVSTDVVKMCVAGVGTREVALGADRAAFPGLPGQGALEVTVDVLAEAEEDTGGGAGVRLGRAGPVVFDGEVLLETTWEPCVEGDCTPCREPSAPVDGADSRLFAVRFL